MKTTLIAGGRIITPLSELKDREILIGQGKILRISPSGTSRDHDTTIDANGLIIAPGFIDVHVQGAGGADVLDAAPQALSTIALTSARFGVTGYLATTVYRPDGDNRHLQVAADECAAQISASRSPDNQPEGAALLGIHLEGPFIAKGRRGMIQEDCLSEIEGRVYELIREHTGSHLRMMTIAPELPGALQLIGRLIADGVIPSFGHSAADYEQTLAGIAAGIPHVTHLFNAMTPMHHREPGPIPALLESEVSAQIIPDGVHIHPAMLRLAAERLSGDRLILISDGMQAMGLPDGRYQYNGLDYVSQDGTARYLDGTLIGTGLGMSELIKRFVGHTSCDLSRAIRAASYNPAHLLGLQDRLGSVEEGRDADLVLLQPDLQVHMTLRSGHCVYRI
jgi:N-acetylglucosamine-6-phosphate deacetylase